MVSQKQDNSEQQEAFIEHLRYAWRCSKGAAQINSSTLWYNLVTLLSIFQVKK